jgi:tRNA (guanine-N7-)-methyltransferase
MPLKSRDPFASRAERLDAGVNPYVALLRDAAASGDLPLAFGPALARFPGAWRERVAEYYGKTPVASLVVEIGCHKGQTLLAMAAARPDTTFVGIDITYKRVVTTAQRAKTLGLTNVYCALANASAFDRLFAAGEVDGVVVFFPDPWVKKARQLKNRLINEAFCGRLHTALRPGGFCWLKTDQQSYFDAAAAALEGAGLMPRARGAGEGAGLPASLPASLIDMEFSSAFEERFHGQGLPTYGGKWLKSAAAIQNFT